MSFGMAFDDPTVGSNETEYFKLSGTEHRPQRVALIPFELSVADLQVPPEIAAAAQAGQAEAVQKVFEIENRKKMIANLLQRKLAEMYNGQNCIYTRVDGAKVAKQKDVGFFLWKDEFPVELEERLEKPPFLRYALLLIEYETLGDPQGSVAWTPAEQQKVFPGSTVKMPFRYNFRIATWFDNQIRDLKNTMKATPTIRHDVLVWKGKQGAFEIQKYAACPDQAAWRVNPEVMAQILRLSRDWWKKVQRNIGKDFTLAEVSKLLGYIQPGYVPTGVQSQSVDFMSMLGTTSNPAAASAPVTTPPVSPPVTASPVAPEATTPPVTQEPPKTTPVAETPPVPPSPPTASPNMNDLLAG